MLNFIKESHNIIGMIILFLLLIVIIGILIRLLRKKPFEKSSKTLALSGLIFVHLQIFLGIDRSVYLISTGIGKLFGRFDETYHFPVLYCRTSGWNDISCNFNNNWL